MAKVKIAERRLPQDGRIKLKVLGHEVDLHVFTAAVWMPISPVRSFLA